MNLTNTVQKHLNEYTSAWQQKIEIQLQHINEMLPLCESPLEQVFFIRIIECFNASLIRLTEGTSAHFAARLIGFPHTERFMVRIFPQYPLHIKDKETFEEREYRADFLITVEREENNGNSINLLWEKVVYVRLIVEIDGHDYHERTKDQAKHDKYRDRFLTKNGFVVFRYTGSEVYNNIGEIIQEIDDYIYRKASEVVKRIGP